MQEQNPFDSLVASMDERTRQFATAALGEASAGQLSPELKQQLEQVLVAFQHHLGDAKLTSKLSLFTAQKRLYDLVQPNKPWNALTRVFTGFKDNSTETSFANNVTCLLALQCYLNNVENMAAFVVFLEHLIPCVEDDKLTHAITPLVQAVCRHVVELGDHFPSVVRVHSTSEEVNRSSESDSESDPPQPPVQTTALIARILLSHLMNVYGRNPDADPSTAAFLLQFYEHVQSAFHSDPVMCMRAITHLYPQLSVPGQLRPAPINAATAALVMGMFEHASTEVQSLARLITDHEILSRLSGSELSANELETGIALSIHSLEAHAKRSPQWSEAIRSVLNDVHALRETETPHAIFDFLHKTALYLNDPSSQSRHDQFQEAMMAAAGRPSPLWKALGISLFLLALVVGASTATAMFAPAALAAGVILFTIKTHLTLDLATATTSALFGAGFYYKGQEHGASKNLHELGKVVQDAAVSAR